MVKSKSTKTTPISTSQDSLGDIVDPRICPTCKCGEFHESSDWNNICSVCGTVWGPKGIAKKGTISKQAKLL